MYRNFIALFLAICMVLCLCSCGQKETGEESTASTDSQEQANSTVSDSPSQTNSQDSSATQKDPAQPDVKLSDNCHKVLASGYDAQNNFYELVANETETYAGTTIEMGVIKNNQWSIPLTTKAPFISENGSLNDPINNKKSIYTNTTFYYIGAGCFYFGSEDIIWNTTTNQYYDYEYTGYYGPESENEFCPVIINQYTQEAVVNNEGLFLLTPPWDYPNYKLLDANTMTITDIDLAQPTDNSFYPFITYPLSEGLFAILKGGAYHDETIGFYDISGQKVIDLSQYYFLSQQYFNAVFIDGKCTLEIKNDQGTMYQITIDKTGAVIDSVAVS